MGALHSLFATQKFKPISLGFPKLMKTSKLAACWLPVAMAFLCQELLTFAKWQQTLPFVDAFTTSLPCNWVEFSFGNFSFLLGNPLLYRPICYLYCHWDLHHELSGSTLLKSFLEVCFTDSTVKKIVGPMRDIPIHVLKVETLSCITAGWDTPMIG